MKKSIIMHTITQELNTILHYLSRNALLKIIALLFPLYSLLLFPMNSQAQMYQDGGKLVYGATLPAINTSAAYINPALLGTAKEPMTTLGLLQTGFDAYSNTMDRGELLQSFFAGGMLNNDTKGKWLDVMQDQTGRFALGGHFTMDWLNYTYVSPKFGGLQIGLRDRFVSRFDIDQQLASQLLLGAGGQDNITPTPDQQNSSLLYFQHVREASVAYGRKIITSDGWHIMLGINYRKLWGVGHFDAAVEDSTVTGNSAFGGLYDEVDYGTTNPEEVSEKVLDNAGHGHAISGGLQAVWKDKVEIGVAALNVSNIEWTQNVLRTEEAVIQKTDPASNGVESYNLKEETGQIYDNFGFERGGTFSTAANGKMRINALYHFNKKTRLYSDILIPLEQNVLENLQTARSNYLFGINKTVNEKINISMALQYNADAGWRTPVGASISLGEHFLLSVTTGDIRTLIAEKNPYTALSFGIILVD